MASKTQPKRKSREKERETEGRFVATKGRQKNPKYSFETDFDNYEDSYADYNYLPENRGVNYGLSL